MPNKFVFKSRIAIRQALQYGLVFLKKTSDSPALDAEILLSHVLKKDRAFLFTYPEKKLSAAQWQKFKKIISRRKKHEPIAYITHHKEFFGLDFYVDRRVLIPRPETEELVTKTIKHIQDTKYKIQNTNICDIGTGSGCIAIAIAHNLPNAKILACDISEKALAVAKLNAKKHKVSKQIKFIHSNLLTEIPKNIKFDVIAANLPYLSQKKYQATAPDIKKYEPKSALYGGKNGNEIYKKLLQQASQHLKKGGKIFLENY